MEVPFDVQCERPEGFECARESLGLLAHILKKMVRTPGTHPNHLQNGGIVCAHLQMRPFSNVRFVWPSGFFENQEDESRPSWAIHVRSDSLANPWLHGYIWIRGQTSQREPQENETQIKF